MTIDELVSKLAESRRVVEGNKDALDDLQDEIDKLYGDRLAMLRNQLKDEKDRVATIEQSIRDAAVRQYGKDGDKHPHDVVAIKVYTVVQYDPSDALALAREMIPKALKLDKRVFDKTVKGLINAEVDGVTDRVKEVVEVVSDPRATIARDLGGY